MTDDLATLPWYPPDERTPNGATGQKPCRRHDWADFVHPESANGMLSYCRRCGRERDVAASRRGRTSRQRGNAFEREVAAKLGGRRVGQYGDKVDVDVEGYLRVQCKVGAAYPERLDGWLRAIPVQAGLLRAVVVGDAPGSSGKRRALIVMDLDEYRDWHGR